MQSFKDKRGAEWAVEITVGSRRDVQKALGLDLYALVEDEMKGLAELLADVERLVQLLYVLCRDQVEERGMDPEHFGRQFTGPVIEAATDALLQEYVSFFPNPQVREGLRKVLDKSAQMAARLAERASRQIDAIDLEREIDSLEKTLRTRSSPAPAA